MSRPVLAQFDLKDTTGRAWEAHLLGADDDTPCCGIVLPEALLRIVVPQEMADPFGPGRTADFDVSDTPLVSMVSVMYGTGEYREPPPAPAHGGFPDSPAGDRPRQENPDEGRRGD